MPTLTASINLFEKLILLLTIASWIFWLVALLLTYRFFRGTKETAQPYTPAVSILIPVKGVDPGAYENFASLCQQDYPQYELLIGVSDPDDPAIPVVETLQREYSGCNISLIVAQPEGTNQKAALLHHLANQARFPIIVAIDSDMRVTPSYLRQVVSPLSKEHVGLVTSCYRGVAPITFTARLEALHMGATFLPQILVARKFLSMRFAMGSTVAVRRRDLEQIGGFASVADYLADDYQIGLRMSLLGREVHLSRYVMASVIGETTFREQWDREVRWARTTRVSRPKEYPGQLLTLSTPLALILLVVTNFDSLAYLTLLVSISLRWLVAWLVSDWTGNKVMRRWMIWLPVRDGLSAVTWLVGGVGNEIVWRGQKFEVKQDGKLVPEPAPAAQPLVGKP
jgi:ceramide glucosyltransferase